MARVLIAEPSYLVRKGLAKLLSQLPGVTPLFVIQPSPDFIHKLKAFNPDILFFNPVLSPSVSREEILATLNANASYVEILYTPLTSGTSPKQISIYDSKSELIEKVSTLLKPYNQNTRRSTETEELTPREKLILKNVALGFTNKEIAARLFISTHTVISHRKNITRKLEIKTVSGLTVYAILNNLIKIEDIT